MEFSLVTIQKLSAPAKEDELKIAHVKLLTELANISQVVGKSSASFALIIMNGLRFVLKEIQVLKSVCNILNQQSVSFTDLMNDKIGNLLTTSRHSRMK